MSDGVSPESRPIFSLVGRNTRASGEARSAGVMLVVALGLGGAVLAFVWEQASREFIHTVRVTFLPEEAAAAEAGVRRELEAIEAARAAAAELPAPPPPPPPAPGG